MRNSCTYNFKTLTNSQIVAYRDQIVELLASYYENPEEVFEMIYPGRIFLTAFKKNKLAGIYTVKHKKLSNNILLAYLGLLVLHPAHGGVLKNLILKHTNTLKEHSNQTIYIYSLTSNPLIHKIASKFYHNIYPRTLQEYEISIPKFYDEIISHTGYNLYKYNSYKVINSPSVARYNRKYRQQLSQYEKYSISELYDLNLDRGDRVLIIGEYKF